MCSFNESVTFDFLFILLKDFILQKGFVLTRFTHIPKNKKGDAGYNNGPIIELTNLMYNK